MRGSNKRGVRQRLYIVPIFVLRKPPVTKKSVFHLGLLELSCDGIRLRVYLEVSELRQHIERNDLLRQSLSNEIDAPRSIAEEA